MDEEEIIQFNVGKITTGVILICLLFFVIEKIFPSIVRIFAFSRDSAWYTIFTNAFMHASSSHLLYNLLSLFLLGNLIELHEGSRITGLIIAASIVVGNIGFALISRNASIGISGAVFGLIGAVVMLHPRKFIYMPLFGIGLKARAFFAGPVIAVGEFLLSLIPAGDGIAHSAHFAGFIAGLVLGWKERERLEDGAQDDEK